VSRLSQIKLLIPVVLLALLALCLGCALIAGLFVTIPSGNYYPLAVGNEWTYRITPGTKTYDVIITQKSSVAGHDVFAVTLSDSYSYLGKINENVYDFGQGEPGSPKNVAFFDPPQLTYPYPWVIGNTWEAPVQSEAFVSDSGPVYVTGSVEGKETLSVPAGLFRDCVKVLVDDPRDSPSDQTDIWFAKGIGIVKTVTYTVIGNRPPTTSTTELVKFKVLPSSL
jgi:hypothetical protein